MRTRIAAAITVVAALGLGGASVPAATAGASVPGVSAEGTAPPAIVHLITGDTVHVYGDGRIGFLPGEGREGIGYHTFRSRSGDGGRYVVPLDAAGPIADGVLDRRLFDVAGLVRDGYAGEDEPPLIVQWAGDASGTLGATATTKHLDAIDADALTVPAQEKARFWDLITGGAGGARAAGIEHVWLDGKARLLLDESVPQVGAPEAWAAGYTGDGVTVAVLDTGYDPAHPDLAGRVTDAVDFTGTSPAAIDGHGHGTHVASTVAGTGAASDGRYTGVAPGADLVIGKVCDDSGSCDESDIIAGMQWAAGNGVAAANLSLGGYPSDGTNPIDLAVDELTETSGTLFVIAAGNDGCDLCVASPATADAALAVGSVTKTDGLSDFSSRGPRLGDFAVKPDISAPGSGIVAARATGTAMGEPVDDLYTMAGGTSMATPHVTGAAALLKQAHPDWTAGRLKAALMGSAQGIDGLTVYEQGAGRLDAGAAVAATVTPDVGSLSFGTFAHPYGQPAESRTVTYTNGSGVTVDLRLGIDMATTHGAAAPAGLFTMDKTGLVLAPGESGTVTVTVDPSVTGVSGTFGGVLTAEYGSGAVRTAVGARLEPPSYDLTIATRPRDGGTVDQVFGYYLNTDTGEGDFFEAGNKAVLTVNPGRWQLVGFTLDWGADTPKWATLFAVDVTVSSGPKTVTWDAAKGKRLKSTVDKTDAVPHGYNTDMVSATADGSAGLSMGFAFGPATKGYLVPGTALSGAFRFAFHPVLVSPAAAANPYQYNLSHYSEGRLPAEPSFVVHDEDLAVEDVRYHGQGGRARIIRSDFAVWTGTDLDDSVRPISHELPWSRTEYYTAAPGLVWSSTGLVTPPASEDGIEWLDRDEARVPGRTTVDWNNGPLMPGFDDPARVTSLWVSGDELHAAVPMFTGPDPRITTFHAGYPYLGRTELLLDGRVVGTTADPCGGSFALPVAEPRLYTLRCAVDRNQTWSILAPSATAEFTFTAGHTAEPTLVSANAVRVSSPSIVDGFASAKRRQTVNLDVYRQPGAADPGTRRLSFEVSYDDGATWTKVVVHRVGDHATASLVHPEGLTFVSLRVSAADNAGNTVTATMMRAFALS